MAGTEQTVTINSKESYRQNNGEYDFETASAAQPMFTAVAGRSHFLQIALADIELAGAARTKIVIEDEDNNYLASVSAATAKTGNVVIAKAIKDEWSNPNDPGGIAVAAGKAVQCRILDSSGTATGGVVFNMNIQSKLGPPATIAAV